MSALQRQVGGLHYKGRKFQPVEMWVRNKLDAFVGSGVKYVDRWRDKGGKADLQKAIHLIQLREEIKSQGLRGRINPVTYCRENGKTALETSAIVALDGYQRGLVSADDAIAAIQRIIDEE